MNPSNKSVIFIFVFVAALFVATHALTEDDNLLSDASAAPITPVTPVESTSIADDDGTRMMQLPRRNRRQASTSLWNRGVFKNFMKAAVLLTMALQAPQQANACSCYPWPPPVCASLNNADVIVVATAQSVEPTGEGLFDDIKYDVEVTNVYKEDEPVTQNLDVFTANNCGLCGLSLQLGVPYLLYLRRNLDNELTVGLCSGSQKWEFVSDETKQLLTSDEHTCCDQEEAAECGIFNECKVVSGNTKCCPNLCPVPLILPGEPNPFAVCGTDDNTYVNECALDQAVCSGTDPTLEVAYPGECCPDVECNSDDDMRPPVCVSDCQTYTNACELEKANCRAGGQLTVLRRGACGESCHTNGQQGYAGNDNNNGDNIVDNPDNELP